jgi:hypothetical protein
MIDDDDLFDQPPVSTPSSQQMSRQKT